MRRQQQVETLKAAMDEAHDNAQRDKHQKRMQHLEEAGHDVSHLKANLQGNDLFKCLTMSGLLELYEVYEEPIIIVCLMKQIFEMTIERFVFN